jgi:hypothetical protein
MPKYSRKHINVWKKYNGKIPKDDNGRSFEIHHIDGNPLNNEIENLKCVSIEEHYKIHLEQEDYGGAFLIARRMKISPEEISELARKQSFKQLEKGIHNFQNNKNRNLYVNKGYVVARNTETDEIVRIKKEDFDNNEIYVGANTNRKMKSIHTNRGKNKNKTWKQKNKEQPTQKCLYCDFTGRGSHISRYHNEKCKMRGK